MSHNLRHEFTVQSLYRQVNSDSWGGASVPQHVWEAATEAGFIGFPPGAVISNGTSQLCPKCRKWYNIHQQTSVCPHISLELPKPELPVDEELKVRKQGYAFARIIESRGIEPMLAVNSCPYGEAYPNNDNLKAHAWYAGWWFFWYVVKRWIDVALGVKE